MIELNDLPSINGFGFEVRPAFSDLADLLSVQTPVKSQGKRGTCSIFSATAMLESLLKMHTKEELDLSENYLQYLVMARLKPWPQEGSDTDKNVPAFQRWGTIDERVWPYEEYDWTASDLPEPEVKRRHEVCGGFGGRRYQACVLSHQDPDHDPYGAYAGAFWRKYQTYLLGYQVLRGQHQIQQLLAQGYPLILSVEFFYGAWNHRKM